VRFNFWSCTVFVGYDKRSAGIPKSLSSNGTPALRLSYPTICIRFALPFNKVSIGNSNYNCANPKASTGDVFLQIGSQVNADRIARHAFGFLPSLSRLFALH